MAKKFVQAASTTYNIYHDQHSHGSGIAVSHGLTRRQHSIDRHNLWPDDRPEYG